MPNDFTRVAPNSTGNKIDAESVTGGGPAGADTVQRQRAQIAGAAIAEVVKVTNAAPGATDYGAVVRVAPPGVAAGDIAKAEDAAHASGDTGILLLAVRNDTPSNLTNTDGDYSGIAVDIKGRLRSVTEDVLGTTTDAAVDGDVNGSVAAKLRGLAKIFTDVWVDALNALGVVLRPATSGGLGAPFHLIAANSTNATNVKASAGQLYGWHITNADAAWCYVKVHNNAGTPTAGAGVVKTIGVPPGGGTNVSLEHGIAFATGIAITTTTGIADADTAAVPASKLNINLYYK